MFRAATIALLLGVLTGLPDALAGAGPPPGSHKPAPGKGHGAAFRRIHQQIKDLRAACEVDPKAWEPRYKLAGLAMQFGLNTMAAKRIDEALALKPDHVPTLELAGKARFGLKQYDKAVELWSKALKLTPKNSKLQVWITQAKSRRDDDAKLAELDARLEKTPADADARLARARLRAKRKRWKEVLADTAVLLAASPDAAEALGLAAMANFRLNRLDDAIGLWTRAVKADPKNVAYPLWLKKAQQLKETREGLARVREQLTKTPNDGKLRLQAGELWARLGNHRYAALNLGEAVRLLPKDANAHRLYGSVLLRLGRMAEAVKELETCVKLDPSNADYKKLLDGARRTASMHRAMKGTKGRGPALPKHGMPPK